MASEAFMGHTLTKFGVESLYDFCITRIDWLRSEYMKVLNAVTFLKPLEIKVEDGKVSQKIRDLEVQIEALKNLINTLDQRTKQLLEDKAELVERLRREDLAKRL